MRYFFILLFVALNGYLSAQSNVEDAIIPLPNVLEIKPDFYLLSKNMTFRVAEIAWDKNIFLEKKKFIREKFASGEIELLKQGLKSLCNINLKYHSKNDRTAASLELMLDKYMDSAAYTMDISIHGIQISAATNLGFFYAFQSLMQLVETSTSNRIHCLHISDSPQFSWRGMHLDCSRHFFSVAEVKRYIDLMSLYKMNVFHWHLTDDQGWRIEIKKYPKLAQISAWRNGSMVGEYSDKKFDSIPYGGYYTQNQIREVVSYAAQRHITIVPEIEMPGHSLAVLAAYPEFGCNNSKLEVGKMWGVFDDVFCAGNDSVYIFLQNVLDEVIALFPGKYIHIGGDECPKTFWKVCEKCQNKIKENQLADEHQLQSYFVQRIEKYVNSKGKSIIGWDEILEGGLAPNAAVMSWRGTSGGIAAAQASHFVVMTPGNPCYFDHYQAKNFTTQPHAIGGYNPLSAVYAFNPIPAELSNENAQYILGAQGNVWTEYVLTFSQVEYMAMPRMIALAENLWTYDSKQNFDDFVSRLKINTSLLDKRKVNYSKQIE